MQLQRSNVWGTLHSFHYVIDGKPFGGNVNVPAFGKLSYRFTRCKLGHFFAEIDGHKQAILDEDDDRVRVYVPDGYDAKVPSATMIFLDGNLVLGRDGGSRTLEVLDTISFT